LVEEAAEWLAQNYDPEWVVCRALRGGVALHYGPLPRSIQRIAIRLFNDEYVPVLVCTSTLIEGVNTAARSVIIYDKAIDGQTLDFFTFSNIRGRAGRMFKHFLGRVYTFMAPPDSENTEVDIPIETQSKLASLAALVQLDRSDLSPDSLARLEPILNQTALSVDTIRKNRGIAPELQIELARTLRGMSDQDLEALAWTGIPSGDRARFTLELAFEHLISPQERNYTSFESIWAQLNSNRINSRDLGSAIDQQVPFSKDQNRARAVDDVLKFKRAWMDFKLPSILRTTQEIVAEVAVERGVAPGNYDLVVHQIESKYLPAFFADLEDYGLPLPLSLKLEPFGLGGETLDELLASLRELAVEVDVRNALSVFELWVLDDVVLGL
jgi:hypothetical protein